MSNRTIATSKKPHLIVGAGELISHVQRLDSKADGLQYQLNLFRICGNGEASHWLRPEDLRDIVKTCQVLAFSIADDGWVGNVLHRQLIELVDQLQRITNRWEQHNG